MAIRRVRAPAAEEARIKAERRQNIFTVMSYDSLYHRKGDLITAGTVGILIGITTNQAAHCLLEMAKDLKLDAAKFKSVCKHGSHMANAYKARQVNQLSQPWRKHPNFHPMPSRYQLGAPI
jgi:hypothetical protein